MTAAAIIARQFAAAAKRYADALVAKRPVSDHDLREFVMLADAVFETDVSEYGPFGDAKVREDEYDAEQGRINARECRADARYMHGDY